MSERIVMTSTSAEFFAQYCAERTGEPFFPARKLMQQIETRRFDGRNDYLFLLGLYQSIGPHLAHRYTRMVKAFKRAVVMWAGTDIQQVLQHPEKDALLTGLQAAGAIFVTESEEVQKRIRELFGQDTHVVYLPSGHAFDPDLAPMPERFTVSTYQPPGRQGFYNRELLVATAKAMPDVPFHFVCKGGYGGARFPEESVPNIHLHHEDIPQTGRAMQEFLAGISCGVRVVHHDTYSMTAIEHVMAGRWFILNYQMPACDVLDRSFADVTVETLVAKLREIQNRPGVNAEGAALYRSRHLPSVFHARLKELLSA